MQMLKAERACAGTETGVEQDPVRATADASPVPSPNNVEEETAPIPGEGLEDRDSMVYSSSRSTEAEWDVLAEEDAIEVFV